MATYLRATVVKKRQLVLFIAEAVTLAHVARPIALARALRDDEFEVVIACATRYQNFFPRELREVRPIHSISADEFLSRLARGSPLYKLSTLRAYVREDLELLDALKPALVVGDFRLSLSVSARLRRVPYIALCNAYWSPYARQHFRLASHPMSRVLGRTVASLVFRAARPIAFAYHALPMNRLRREFGLPSLGGDLRRVYTDGDYVAYADIPELIPTYALPANHCYIGPVQWSAPVPSPQWWDRLDSTRPLIYVTLGSSGDHALLPRVLEALASLPAQIALATAGAPVPPGLPSNVHCAEYLPGDAVAKRARLVVCNGGSPTTYQALIEGVPVIGLTSNMDQVLNMDYVAARGAGAQLIGGEFNAAALHALARRMLHEPGFTSAAAALRTRMRALDPADGLKRIMRQAAP